MEIIIGVLALALVSGASMISSARSRRQTLVRRLVRKLDVYLEDAGLAGDVWPPAPPDALRHMEEGRMIEGIRAYREAHPGMGLLQARLALLEATGRPVPGNEVLLEQRIDTLIRAAGLQDRIFLQVADEVRELMRNGEKIKAIEALRRANPLLGLAEAKAAVEGLH